LNIEVVRYNPAVNPKTILTKSKNWKSCKSQLKTLFNKQKGDAFELLTKHYLQLHPTYETKLKHVWLLSEVSVKVRRKLNLPDTDEGWISWYDWLGTENKKKSK
jgi:hypothetical protein